MNDINTADRVNSSNQELVTTKANHRRVNKTLVEFAIGIVGIIGIMLAQIGQQSASNNNLTVQSELAKANIAYQLSGSITRKAASLSAVSPIASAVNWNNILL